MFCECLGKANILSQLFLKWSYCPFVVFPLLLCSGFSACKWSENAHFAAFFQQVAFTAISHTYPTPLRSAYSAMHVIKVLCIKIYRHAFGLMAALKIMQDYD